MASDFVAGHVLYYRRFSEFKTPLFGFDMFAGAGAHVASIRSDAEAAPDKIGIVGWDIFGGMETPLLPFYFGYGYNNDHESALYLALGRLAAGRR